MPEQEIRNSMDCSVDAYWKCVFDEEYNRRLYLEALKFREFKLLSQTDGANGSRSRKVYLNPPAADLPGPVAKVVGDLSWTEEGTWDPKTGRYKFKVTPASLPDKTRIDGEIWCEARGDKSCDRIAKAFVEVKVFMVGGIVEKRIIDDMKKSYENAARFTNQWVKEKGW
ncbi:MAG: DUF2505 domain-containing protein [Myxococcales bacterium]|nr:DUF2505 domain-containing protein [Myxococcales bacterium]